MESDILSDLVIYITNLVIIQCIIAEEYHLLTSSIVIHYITSQVF